MKNDKTLKQAVDLGRKIGVLIADDHCVVCERVLDVTPDGTSAHEPDCPVSDIMATYKAMLVSLHEMLASNELDVPDKMPAQGIYTNMVTLLALSNILVNSGAPASETNSLANTITGTLVGLARQLKRHIPGKSVIDQVLAFVPSPSNEVQSE